MTIFEEVNWCFEMFNWLHYQRLVNDILLPIKPVAIIFRINERAPWQLSVA